MISPLWVSSFTTSTPRIPCCPATPLMGPPPQRRCAEPVNGTAYIVPSRMVAVEPHDMFEFLFKNDSEDRVPFHRNRIEEFPDADAGAVELVGHVAKGVDLGRRCSPGHRIKIDCDAAGAPLEDALKLMRVLDVCFKAPEENTPVLRRLGGDYMRPIVIKHSSHRLLFRQGADRQRPVQIFNGGDPQSLVDFHRPISRN